MYCPTTCTHSSDLVRAHREYTFLDGPLKEITSYKIVISNACSLVSVHVSTFVPRLRDKALRGKQPAGDIIYMIPPAPPPKREAAPDRNFPFPPSKMSFPCSFNFWIVCHRKLPAMK